MQVYDWTGFYIGVNAGIGVGQNRTRLDIPAFPSAEQSHLSPFGAIGGAQVGYNWQINKDWLVGLEADIQASGPARQPYLPRHLHALLPRQSQPAARLVRHGARPRRHRERVLC